MKNEKKRKYNSRVTEIEQGTFTPLVFTTTGGMADECLMRKRVETVSVGVFGWVYSIQGLLKSGIRYIAA